MDNSDLLTLLRQHKEYMTTVKEWDDYAKKRDLPSSYELIYKFKTWNKVKKLVGLTVRKAKYSHEDLVDIVSSNKHALIRKSIWDEHAKKNNLPSSSTLIKTFGSWNELRKYMNVEVDEKKRDTYSKSDIKEILESHGDNYLNRTQWDEYAKEHGIPTYKTIRKHFTYKEIMKIINRPKAYDLNRSELIKIASANMDFFSSASISVWNNYAKENSLPSAHTFIRHFGTWNKAKHEVRLKG